MLCKMIQSMNTKVDLTIKATSYLSLASYGHIMIGNQAFEYYNEKNIHDYIQIPWEEVECIIVSVLFNGKWLPRFSLVTKNNGQFIFSTRNNKQTLKTINRYIDANKIVRSLTFLQVFKRGILSIKNIKKT